MDYTRPMSVDALTNREREVLELIATGQTTKAIAAVLDISDKTVEYHRAKLMNKLRLYDVVALTHWALAVGLVKLMFETNVIVRTVTTTTAVPANISPVVAIPKPKPVRKVVSLPKPSPTRIAASKPAPVAYKPVVIPPPRKLPPEPSSPFVLADSQEEKAETITPTPEPVKPQPVVAVEPVVKKPLYKAKPLPKDDSWMVTLCERCGKKHTIGWPC